MLIFSHHTYYLYFHAIQIAADRIPVKVYFIFSNESNFLYAAVVPT